MRRNEPFVNTSNLSEYDLSQPYRVIVCQECFCLVMDHRLNEHMAAMHPGVAA